MKRAFPVIIPNSDLRALKEAANQILDLDLSTGKETVSGAIDALSKFVEKASVLKHFQYTFMILMTYDEFDQLVNQTSLRISLRVRGSGYIAIVTGTLEEWRDFIQLGIIVEARNDIEAYFTNNGLRTIL